MACIEMLQGHMAKKKKKKKRRKSVRFQLEKIRMVKVLWINCVF